MAENNLAMLLHRYIDGIATSEERRALQELLQEPEQQAEIEFLLEEGWETYPGGRIVFEPVESERMLHQILQLNKQKGVVRRGHFLRNAWFRYAAVLLFIAGVGGVVVWLAGQRSPVGMGERAGIAGQRSPAGVTDVLPGGNKAVLTLADGSRIILDSAADGTLVTQGNTKIIKLTAGSLAYHNADRANNGKVMYNTVSTPKGGQYLVMLPDGSRVWLNAASSIRFPTTFNKDRMVTMTGEAYMEIAQNSHQPFFVTVNDINIQVLGTRFNINAYPEEGAIKTTLLEGAVQVSLRGEAVLLKPGQQAMVSQDIQINKKADLEQVTAWKNGLFNFNHASLNQVMSQLARWYDVQIVYEGRLPSRTFYGEMQRSLLLNEVLDILKDSGIKFRINDKILTVTPS